MSFLKEFHHLLMSLIGSLYSCLLLLRIFINLLWRHLFGPPLPLLLHPLTAGLPRHRIVLHPLQHLCGLGCHQCLQGVVDADLGLHIVQYLRAEGRMELLPAVELKVITAQDTERGRIAQGGRVNWEHRVVGLFDYGC
jgi:hypothetical protein